MTITFNLSTLGLAGGTYSVTVAAKGTNLKDSAQSEGVNYTVQTTISFIIGSTSYQAEDGMTWEEWVSSDYNTGGYSIGYADGIYGFVVDDGDGVVVNEAMRTEAIINGKAYTTYAAGPA